MLVGELAGALGIVDRRFDLAAMPHDARILQEALHALGVEAGDLLEVEAGEVLSEGLALAQDGEPAQTGLETFEADLLEEAVVVDDGAAPLVVVVRGVVGRGRAPPAADDAVVALDEPFPHARAPLTSGASLSTRCRACRR